MPISNTMAKTRGWFVACGNCASHGGLVGTPMKRRYFEDKTEYRCKLCKRHYDKELLGSNICPNCKITMGHPKRWEYYCPNCEGRT